MKVTPKKVLFITPYPFDSAGSQRFRFEQYFTYLQEHNIFYKQVPFLDQTTWKIFYKEGKLLIKAWGFVKGLLRRLYCLFIVSAYDRVFIHREAAPIGPPIIEYIIAKILQKKIIFDFDDSIWLSDSSTSNTTLRKLKSSGNKTSKIIEYSYKVYAGNQYLADYASHYNSNVVVVPTIVNTDHHKPLRNQKKSKICIGWTGTHTTLKHFEAIIPTLEKLYKKHKETIYFKLIANKQVHYDTLDLVSTIWNKNGEIDQLSELDIGIMPLPNDKWSNGKCGFKAIQYMALEIPTIVSPVGMNTQLIENNITGFICESEDEWLMAFETLIANESLRIQMGKKARQKIINEFSYESTKDLFVSNLC
ncbi:MAG: glycosyltransferase [Bacteroidetes bacterium]|nr:glycosyltransferase [Bacteroidota bacterium]